MRLVYLFCCLIPAIVGFTGVANAQQIPPGTFKRPWYVPDQAVVQFAGNVGFLSAGLGYAFKQDKMNLDFLYGFTPGFEAKTSIHTVTGKFTYSPWRKNINLNYTWEPFQFGTGISYSIGPQFYTALPKHYPDGYYFWTTSFRLLPFMSTTVSKIVKDPDSVGGIKRVKAYLEVGTHDLAVLSVVTNKTLNPRDIISLAVGTKLLF